MIPEKIGRYEIRAELGRGGMATVYQGHDPRFMREVAIKVLPREFLHDPNFRARFEREARTIAALEHPAIVPVYDFGEEEGQPYIVMRLMTGGSLADRLAHGPIALTEAARIFGQLAPALDRAHSKGIIHRDLKPGNILFDEDGLPYISDFGIAKLTAATSAFTGTAIVGTPAYMSPEQARGDKAIDGRSDIYALGTIVFQMLTGKVPFDADTPMGVALKHITEPVPSILESRPNLPADCDTLIQTAMAKSRDERFPTAGRMAEALTAIASGRPSLAPPPARTPEPRATLVTTPPPQQVRTVKEVPPVKPSTGERRGPPAASESVIQRPVQSASAPQPAKKNKVGLLLAAGAIGLGAVCVAVSAVGLMWLKQQQTPTPQVALMAATATKQNTATPIAATLAVEVVVTPTIPPSPMPFIGDPHPILGDVRVRQGIAYCTNRDELIASVYPFVNDPGVLYMDTFIPKASWANYDGSDLVKYRFNPEKGKALFEEAGWTLDSNSTYRHNSGGEELALKFTTTTAQFRQTWAAVFEAQLKDCGMRIVRTHAPASWWFGATTGLARRDFELGAYAWVGQVDPGGGTLYACDQIPLPGNDWAGQNYMGWCNPVASENIHLANGTIDRRERIEAYKKGQIEFAKDMVSLPLFNRIEIAATDPQLANFNPNPTDYYTWNAYEWSLPGTNTLTLAFSSEPASMYSLIETSWVEREIGKLVFDQGYSTLDYDYQSVLFSVSTVENGLAKNNTVNVSSGDPIIDADGNATTLGSGVKTGNAAGETVVYSSGTVAMKQLVVTYKFNPGVRWSDGEPVVKEDFELAYKNDCDPNSGSPDFFTCNAIRSVVFVSDTQYVVTYKPGYQNPLYFVAPIGFYPSHQILSDGRRLADVPTTDWATLPEIADTPLGVGPYVLTQWVRGSRMILEANPYYWRGTNTLQIKTIVIQFVADANQAATELINGQVDIVGPETLGTGAEAQMVTDAEKQGRAQVFMLPSATWEHVDMNITLLP